MKKTQKKNPSFSSWSCLAVSITGSRIKKPKLEEMLTKLVDKSDYRRAEKDALVEHLYSLSMK